MKFPRLVGECEIILACQTGVFLYANGYCVPHGLGMSCGVSVIALEVRRSYGAHFLVNLSNSELIKQELLHEPEQRGDRLIAKTIRYCGFINMGLP